jgi:ABC-type transport system involved in multi-copper enzyme maturation permease subunit
MTTGSETAYRSRAAARGNGLLRLMHSEWTKFRTVRSWVIATLLAVIVSVSIGLLNRNQCTNGSSGPANACSAQAPTGPDGEAVQDAFYFAHQPLAGNGTISAEIASLTAANAPLPGGSGSGSGPGAGHQLNPALQAWSKAGLIIKENTSAGSPYAAIMVTAAHGVRMQWNFVNDKPGMAGTVSSAAPRWLRLVRTGDTVAGYDSADGTNWALVDTVTLPGLRSTVQAGPFATSPDHTSSANGGRPAALATGEFRHVGLSWPSSGWTGTGVGASGFYGSAEPGTFRQSADAITVSGSGDIAPIASGTTLRSSLAGSFAGLIALLVVGAELITAEYRRGLIRISLTASPRRGRLLAAKVVVVGLVGFATGLAAALLAIVIGKYALTSSGPLLPLPTLTLVRMIVGTAAMFGVAAILALAIGVVVRRSAAAVTGAIVLIFLPYLLAIVPALLPLSAEDWLLRITPAAGFSVQQGLPAYPQVDTGYPPAGGYYPLAPWAGLTVECGWAIVALVLASYLLRRRDA